MPYSRPLHHSSRLRHLIGGVIGTMVLFGAFVGCEHQFAMGGPSLFRSMVGGGGGGASDAEPLAVDVEVIEIPCDSAYVSPPATAVRENGVVRVRIIDRDCCCCDGGSARLMNLARPRGGGTVRPSSEREVQSGDETAPPEGESPPANELDEISALAPRFGTPQAPGFGLGVPVVEPVITEARRAIPWWIGLLAVPFALRDRGGDDPPGTICPDDSGIAVGPRRPRC